MIFVPRGPMPDTARGMTVGNRAVFSSREPCAVFVGTRCDWLWTAQGLGFQPKLVHFRHSSPLVPLVTRLFPEATVIVGSYGQLRTATLPRVAFIHGSVGAFPFLFEHVDVLLSTKGKRGKVPTGWQLSKTRVAHHRVGGVTDAVDHCFLWRRSHDDAPTMEEVSVPTALPRDVHSVISDTVGGTACAKPVASRLPSPQVMELKPGLYHAGGLLPLDHLRGRFAVRSVYTASKWCVRRLTARELATAFDVPHQVASQCSAAELTALTQHPGRGLEHGARALLAHAGVINRGGKYVFSPSLFPVQQAQTTPAAKPIKNLRPGKDLTVEEALKPAERLEANERAAKTKIEAKKKAKLVATDATKAKVSQEATLGSGESRKVAGEDRDLKAVKADDAAVPVWLWNDAIIHGMTEPPNLRGHSEKRIDEALETLRMFVLNRKFKLGVTRSFLAHLKNEHPELQNAERIEVNVAHEGFGWKDGSVTIQYQWRPRFGKREYRNWWNQFWRYADRDKAPGKDAVYRAAESSWWEWDQGSAPFYWRWPPAYRGTIRDGLEIWFSGEKPKWRRPQKVEKNKETHAKVVKKIAKVRKRKYIAPGHVWSLTDFFSVPKGDEDIRMVYNGTSSGLNDVLWVPSFPLPTVDTLLRSVHPGTWMADTDLGEMFLNFVLHESLRELAGVDVTHYQDDENPTNESCWERWIRCAMGLKSSPYQTTQAMLMAEDVMRGDPNDPKNVFRWDDVKQNLPGDPEYDPSLPWVYKVRKDGTPAADFFFYVDDNRTTGSTQKEAWQAARRVASVCSHLGIQDASRKRRKASKTPGAWAGAIVSSDEEGVYVSVSQEKWEKAQTMIAATRAEVAAHQGWLGRKDLERRRGFLLYVTRTFPAMVPYLKGFHLTIDGWRTNRDSEGWKYYSREIRELQEKGEDIEMPESPEAPQKVKAKARLTESDLPALARLFDSEVPPKRRIRSRKVVDVYYGFGDASQDGFGFNIQKPEDDTIHYRFGQWCDEIAEKTSNYRELYNLVTRLEEMVEEGSLRGAEVFLFTDNSTAESVYYKGNSSSKALYELMLRLRDLEMKGDLVLHVIHVSGTRMEGEGADGASRGLFTTGVMAGHHVLEYIPLSQSALEEEPGLKDWLEKCWNREMGDLKFQEPKDWFRHGHQGNNFVWAPAPAAAEVAAELMARGIHKYPDSCHIFVCPRLMTARWRRRVGKLADFKFELGAGSKVWGAARHEPLLIYVCLPLSKHRPWKLQGTKFVDELDRKMRGLHETNCKGRGRVLRKLFLQSQWLDSMPEGMVRGMLLRAQHQSIPDQACSGRRGKRPGPGRGRETVSGGKKRGQSDVPLSVRPVSFPKRSKKGPTAGKQTGQVPIAMHEASLAGCVLGSGTVDGKSQPEGGRTARKHRKQRRNARCGPAHGTV
jgi:hypothetical protein